MRRFAAIGGLAAFVAVASVVGAVAARGTAVAPPAAGSWRAVADSADAKPPIYDFKGTFTIKGDHVMNLTGVITHTYPHDEGCVTGTKVTVLGTQPIVHTVGPGFDSYQAAKKTAGTTAPLLVRVQAGKQIVPGTLFIRFNTPGQIQSHSDLTFGETIGCHLEFDVTR